MKIVVITYPDDDSDHFKKFVIRPATSDELYEAAQDVVSFINECYVDLKEEGEE